MTEINKTFAFLDYKKWGKLPENEDEPIWCVVVVPFYKTIMKRLTILLRYKQLQTISYPHRKLNNTYIL